MKIGFDNEKYLTMQSEHIKQRIGEFGDKLYGHDIPAVDVENLDVARGEQVGADYPRVLEQGGKLVHQLPGLQQPLHPQGVVGQLLHPQQDDATVGVGKGGIYRSMLPTRYSDSSRHPKQMPAPNSSGKCRKYLASPLSAPLSGRDHNKPSCSAEQIKYNLIIDISDIFSYCFIKYFCPFGVRLKE